MTNLTSLLDASAVEIMRAMKPGADPACQMPEFDDFEVASLDELPSVSDVEEALRSYVVEKEDPTPLLQSLFPTLENISFSYQAGKGVKRPSIALTLHPLNCDIHRMSVAHMAQELCERARKLGQLNVGSKATSEKARDFLVEVYAGYSSVRQNYILRANTPMEAAMAYRVVFNASVANIGIPLDVTTENVLNSAKVAYKLMSEYAAGNSSMRVKAQKLIRACDEASVMAALCFRSSAYFSPYEQSWITIDLDNGHMTYEKERKCASQHELLQLETHINGLRQSLLQLWEEHDVLQSFPKGWVLELQGEGPQKIASLKFPKAPGSSIILGVSCSLLDIGNVEALSQHLNNLFSEDEEKVEKYNWILEIEGDVRSSHAFSLEGETLREAIASHFIEKGERMSMHIQELLLDLMCDRSGQAPKVRLQRMIQA